MAPKRALERPHVDAEERRELRRAQKLPVALDALYEIPRRDRLLREGPDMQGKESL